MLIIVDARMPEMAKQRLEEFGNLMELETSGLVYSAISGHPDIFFCQTNKNLVLAPNLPEKYLRMLQKQRVRFEVGGKSVENKYPGTATYNASIGNRYLIHNLNYTDVSILDASHELEHIHVNQGYARCNLISLNDGVFITSDPGIHKTLIGNGLACKLFPAENIVLPGFDHGFVGGACGVWDQKIFLCGSLRHYSWSKSFASLVESAGFQIIELSDGLLHDVGSMFFIDAQSGD